MYFDRGTGTYDQTPTETTLQRPPTFHLFRCTASHGLQIRHPNEPSFAKTEHGHDNAQDDDKSNGTPHHASRGVTQSDQPHQTLSTYVWKKLKKNTLSLSVLEDF